MEDLNEIVSRKDANGFHMVQLNIGKSYKSGKKDPTMITELNRPLRPSISRIRLYCYIDQEKVLSPIGVEHQSGHPITALNILMAISFFYDHLDFFTLHEGWHVYIHHNCERFRKRTGHQPRDVIGNRYFKGLVPYKDGYLVEISD